MGINFKHKCYAHPYGCMVEATLDVIGGKWKGPILYHLLDGRKRFNELRKMFPGLTQRMLTLQLRDLERDGIVRREVFPEVPPRVEYSLTDFGRTLTPVLEAMRQWGTDHLDRIRELREQAVERQTA